MVGRRSVDTARATKGAARQVVMAAPRRERNVRRGKVDVVIVEGIESVRNGVKG